MKNVARKSSKILPGQNVRGSTSGRPLMVVFDLLGRRWALGILWALRQDSLRFRELQAVTGASPSVLNDRLRELRDARLVDSSDQGYCLSASGLDLLLILKPLNQWAALWSEQLRLEGDIGTANDISDSPKG